MGRLSQINQGEKYNFLTILYEVSKIGDRRAFKCKCDCGNTTDVILKDIVRGHTKSCGCHKINVLDDLRTTHGKSKTKLYHVWKSMRQRCINPNTEHYKDYGGRGISVCDPWNDYEIFYEWSKSNGYADGLSIDRIDVDGNYCPENCRWTTQIIQVRNARSNNKITFNNKTQCLSEWAEELGIKRSTLSGRINTGRWSIEKSLTTAI